MKPTQFEKLLFVRSVCRTEAGWQLEFFGGGRCDHRTLTTAIARQRRDIVHVEKPGFAAPVHCLLIRQLTRYAMILSQPAFGNR